eukprot:CAMPEP_0197551000 /NCGR_PEP_ID=MMETSP1320-20131121/4400_1 /TAXON_ID=91990 /ORGANISM="Bolidomonas sp., Strain RCC2347" /LENGTH=604 /DNA_ID=CAMNT_0043111437 /DNA_START=220 /DNA_END=2034 /DNA_ORIENTATION=+
MATESFVAAIPALLEAVPPSWYGTTFPNLDLKSREVFSASYLELLSSSAISPSSLDELGHAEDYFRVATNLSTILETYYSLHYSVSLPHVLTFRSKVMPLVALLRQTPLTVVQEGKVLDQKCQKVLKSLGCDLKVVSKRPKSKPAGRLLVLFSSASASAPPSFEGYDAVVFDGVLVFREDCGVDTKETFRTRKRMSSPLSTPRCVEVLDELTGKQVKSPAAQSTSALLAHLQSMSGSSCPTQPLVFSSGLPSLNAYYASLLLLYPADTVTAVMASTAYGGSSELTDLNVGSRFNKATFAIQGDSDYVESVKTTLSQLSGTGPVVVFCEFPSNPDMKVPDLNAFLKTVHDFKSSSGREVHLLVDTTFAPPSKVLDKIGAVTSTLPACAFISLSKSVSRGLTCAGCIVGNKAASKLMVKVSEVRNALDTQGDVHQSNILCENHEGVETRVKEAYELAFRVGEVLKASVKEVTGVDMPLNFVTPQNAEDGFTSSTYSFNLPPPANATAARLAALAQDFVDILQKDKVNFKPCVSFGQDNKLVYLTVPATSTQGAIKEEDKAQQAKGGVQLTRFSFPVSVDDIEVVEEGIRRGVKEVYGVSGGGCVIS